MRAGRRGDQPKIAQKTLILSDRVAFETWSLMGVEEHGAERFAELAGEPS